MKKKILILIALAIVISMLFPLSAAADDSQTGGTRVITNVPCTVTFFTNGHGSVPPPQTVPYGETASQPQPPYEEDWTFCGWFSDSDLQTAFDFSTPITTDTSVYAKWVKNTVIPADPDVPQTGDTTDIMLWIGLMAISMLVLSKALRAKIK